MTELVRMRNIHLSFSGTSVLNGVDFQLKAGEIHALIGEHRSGKTSLMRILAGELRPGRGTVSVAGRSVTFSSPNEAAHAGIGMVHQNLQIIPSLNAVENIFARTLPRVWFRFRRYGEYIRRTEAIFLRMGVTNLNLSVPTGVLPEAQQQAVEIARIVAQDPRIVILDEVAQRQSKVEMERLFRLMQEFRDAGKGIVYITDNVNEVFEIADRVTVLADGHRKNTELVKNLDRLKLVRMAFNFALDQQENVTPLVLRQFNETVIRDLPVGVFIFDEDGRLFHVNDEAERLCERSSVDLVGDTLDEILAEHLERSHDEILSAVHEDTKRVWDGVPFGCAEFTRIQTTSIRDDDFNTLGRVILVQDETMDQAMAEYIARAEKMESTAELAAGVAHEINNPLATIRNYVEILRLRNTDGDTGTKLDRISAELDRIVEIVGSLLSFSKVRAGGRQPVDVVALTRETVTLLGHRFREKRLGVRFSLPDSPVTIPADENRLKQVLINILVNSIEATLDGEEISIAVELLPERNGVGICIRDSGSGIPDQVRDQIFRPFYSTKASRTNTGLGLSICKHIVESHGGTITVESRAGEFTEVKVFLPE